jgi:hypothetical protein
MTITAFLQCRQLPFQLFRKKNGFFREMDFVTKGLV